MNLGDIFSYAIQQTYINQKWVITQPKTVDDKVLLFHLTAAALLFATQASIQGLQLGAKIRLMVSILSRPIMIPMTKILQTV